MHVKSNCLARRLSGLVLHPVRQTPVGLTPGQGTDLGGCGFDPIRGTYKRQPMDVPLSPSPFSL